MTNITNNNHHISSRLTPPPSFNTTSTRVASWGGGGGCGSGGNGSQACAACKYQRRRCAPDCPLAPYFPVERQKDFLNAHKLFGVSNILKVLKNVAPFQKDNAMKALIFEANIRASDPVGGCYRIILNLHRQINLHQAELQFVYREIFQVQAMDIQEHRNNINTKACSIQGINNNTLNFGPSPLHDIHGFSRSCIGEASNDRIVKGEEFEGFNSDEEFETKVAMSSSKDKHLNFKPGNFDDYKGKGKGVATVLSNDKIISKTRVN